MQLWIAILCRKYSLIGATPLLQLVPLVAAFSPIAEELIPFEEKLAQLACKMQDILLDYRPRAVNAKLKSQMSICKQRDIAIR